MIEGPERTVEQITTDTCAEIDEIFAKGRADVSAARLIPKTDAEQAVALAYQRAATEAEPWCGPLVKSNIVNAQSIAAQQIKARILALAPADALAEVERMKADLDELKAYRDYGPRMDEKRQAAIMELALGPDRIDRVEALQAAEAEVARLREALNAAIAAWDDSCEYGDQVDGGWVEFARAALKGDTP